MKLFISGKESAHYLGAWLGLDRNQTHRRVKTDRTLGVKGLNPHHAQHHGKMPRCGRETKEEAAKTYLAGTGSQKETCKRFGIRSTHALQNWRKVFHAHGAFNSRKGSGGGSYMKQGRNTTQDERRQPAKVCLESRKKQLGTDVPLSQSEKTAKPKVIFAQPERSLRLNRPAQRQADSMLFCPDGKRIDSCDVFAVVFWDDS